MRDEEEKGNTPVSMEVALFGSTLAFYIYLVFFLPTGVARIGVALKDLFEHPEQWQLGSSIDLISLASHLMLEAGYFLLPAAVMFVIFGLASSMLQNMPAFVLDRIMPKWERVSPVSGFKRIYSSNGMVQFGKSLSKILVVSMIMFFAIKSEYYRSLDGMVSDPQTILVTLARVTKKMIVVILICTAIIAIIDVFWTRHHWFTQLKMTKQDIKDEMKQSQGDPIVKARQRSIARDRARKRMINNVPRATLIITNPTHYAIALRYAREEGDAPIVVAKGQDLIALKIREIAQENGIPIFEDPPLARSMFAQVSVDSVIPSVFYKAVAELIHRVYAARRPNRRVR